MAERHFVKFFGYRLDLPREQIAAWDPALARTRALTILPRPFGFRFTTWDIQRNKPDALVALGPAYFFADKALTRDDLRSGDYLCRDVWASEVERTGLRRVATGNRKTEVFRDGDVLLAPLV